MIDVQALDRTGRRQVLHGLLAQYNLGSESAKVALGMAHQNLPGFTALMEQLGPLRRAGKIEVLTYGVCRSASLLDPIHNAVGAGCVHPEKRRPPALETGPLGRSVI